MPVCRAEEKLALAWLLENEVATVIYGDHYAMRFLKPYYYKSVKEFKIVPEVFDENALIFTRVWNNKENYYTFVVKETGNIHIERRSIENLPWLQEEILQRPVLYKKGRVIIYGTKFNPFSPEVKE